MLRRREQCVQKQLKKEARVRLTVQEYLRSSMEFDIITRNGLCTARRCNSNCKRGMPDADQLGTRA